MPTYEYQDNNNKSTGNQPDKIQRAMSPMSTPVECPECGSSYFYSTYAEQVSSAGYGSVEYRSISPSPIPIKVCLCGAPLVPKNLTQGGAQSIQTARNAFYNSASKAADLRKRLKPDNLLKVLASQSDLDILKKSLNDTILTLLNRLAELEAASSSQEVKEQDTVDELKTVNKQGNKRKKE